MATPLLLTKSALTQTTYTPAQIVADTAIETAILTYTYIDNSVTKFDGIEFVVALMTAYRSGLVTEVDFTFSSGGGVTAFQKATAVANYLSATEHNYTVTGPVPLSGSITVSWA